MRFSIAALPLAVAAAQALPTLPKLTLPSIPVLPVKGVPDVLAGNGLQSIASTLIGSTQPLSLSADGIASASAKITGDASVSANPNVLTSLDLARTLQGATNTLWSTATEVEKKLCSLVLSINQQNLAAQQANLVAAINAEAQVLTKLGQSVGAAVGAVASQAGAFTEAERAILTQAVAAVAAATQASFGPLQKLADGVKSIGLSSVADAVNSLQVSVSTITSAAAGAAVGVQKTAGA